jgi:hypothetical protein
MGITTSESIKELYTKRFAKGKYKTSKMGKGKGKSYTKRKKK